jgi:hypothetical protein
MRRLLLASGLLLAAAVALPGSASAAACVWTPSALPLPVGVEAGEVVAGAGDGVLAGSVGDSIASDTQGVIWSNGQAYPLGKASGMSTRVRGVNRNGVAVGYATDGAQVRHAIRYRADRWERLAESGYFETVATDVNVHGDVVGYQVKSDRLTGRFVIWAANGTTPVRELALPGTNEFPQEIYVDDDGSAAGWSYEWDWEHGAHLVRGYVWTPDGRRTQLEAPYHSYGVQVAAFRYGRILGRTDREDLVDEAAEWNVRGEFVGHLSGGNYARGVNRSGMVLGSVDRYFYEPIVWQPDGKVEALPGPAGSFWVRANAINDEQVGGEVDGMPAAWTRSC